MTASGLGLAAAGLTATAATGGLVATQVPLVDNAIQHAQAIEKMGIIAILGLCLILSVFALIWIAHRFSVRWEALTERAIAALASNERMSVVASQSFERAATDMKQSATVLGEITTRCRVSIERSQ